MAKQKNWKADIYDLASERPLVIEAEEDTEELETQPEPVSVAPIAAAVAQKSEYNIAVKYRTAPKSSDFYTLGGMIAGAVAGALVGLFLAPERGETTRKQIVERARQQIDQGIDKVQEVR